VIEGRHIADSMLFALGWPVPPSECWDLGSGAGLPGLVLAVLWPDCRMMLIDRSERRMDLARRAARVARIDVATRRADIADLEGPVEAVVSRAAMPASALLPHLRRILAPGGRAVVSGHGFPVDGYQSIEVDGWYLGDGILARPPRLLMMQQP
jgi:16S rRNA (guanine527-N7)-methyltransferase